jgi:hypothetical protein
VWYFPTPSSPAPRVEPATEAQTLPKGIVVGPEHPSGRYRVHVVLSATPLSRDEALRAEGPAVVASDTIDVEVVDP